MPEKRNIYRSYGDKLISLFARLLFSGESYSLTDLARILHCSKQTVLRLVDDICRAYNIDIEETFEGNRKYFRIKKPGRIPPALHLTEMELNVLYMCQTFAKHLLGDHLYEEAAQALLKSRALLPEGKGSTVQHFASFRPGSIDYTPHQETFRSLIEAMDESRICEIDYQALWDGKTKTFYIKPLKIFSHQDTVYLHVRMARTPGEAYKEPEFDPLLAVHRIREIEVTERGFKFPKDYDFEKQFNQEFGVIKDESFEVEVEFTGWAAKYVTERTWSPDQKVKKKANGKTILTFTASSDPELVSWLLSFKDEAKLLKPKWVVEKVGKTTKKMAESYASR